MVYPLDSFPFHYRPFNLNLPGPRRSTLVLSPPVLVAPGAGGLRLGAGDESWVHSTLIRSATTALTRAGGLRTREKMH